MIADAPSPPASSDELTNLIETLHRVEQRIEKLTAGEVDTVANHAGRTVMLRRAQEHLRHTEALRQAAILNALPAHIALLDPAGRVTSVNEAWRGFASPNALQGPEYGVGVNYPEVCEGARGELAAEAHQAAAGIRAVLAGTTKAFSIEYPCHSASGWRWFLMMATPLAGERPDGAVVMHLDITERKRDAEELLRFGAAVDALADAVYLVDRSSMRFVHVNDAACRALGKTRAQALVLAPWKVLAISRAALAGAYDALIASGVAAEPIELLRDRNDGSKAWVELRRHAQCAGGRWTIVTLVRDITERKLAEETRLSLEAQLRESQKMEAIGALAGGVAHDFNNILGAILGNTELARQDAGASPLAIESLEEIRKAGIRARALVQQILSFSRRQPTTRRVISLAAVVKESLGMLRATIPQQVSFDMQLSAHAPTILADVTQLQQVLVNLVTNAAHAMRGRSGKVTIGVDTFDLTEPSPQTFPGMLAGRHARLVVADTGHGMDGATLARIFEPFFTTKAMGEGTGLGLAVVQGIVRANDGHIVVDSEPGNGSTFTLYFPAAQSAPGAVDAVDVAPPAPRLSGRGRHVLYIDDDVSMLFLVKRLLQRRGFRVSEFSDQVAGLDALRADPAGFALVVTDYNMPGLTGLDVAREARKIRPDLPLALVSGYITDELRVRAAEIGVHELIFKANAVDEFCDVIARLLPDLR